MLRQRINDIDIGRLRFWVQLALFGLFIYGGYLKIDINQNLPTFACPFVGEDRGGTCFLFPLQHMVNMPWKAFATGRLMGLVVALVTFWLFFILLNKAWCGWACPLGTIQDWLTMLRRKLGMHYSRYSEETFHRLKPIKFVLLALLILLPLGISNSLLGLPRFSHDMATAWCMVCPGRTVLPLFAGEFSQLAIDFSSETMLVLTALGMMMFALFFVGSFVKTRFFCLFCPMSALHYLFSRSALLGLRKRGEKCTKCGDCYRACDVGIFEIADDVEHPNRVTDDCTMCFKCVAACPEEDCLEATFAGLPIYSATESGFFKRMEAREEDHDESNP